MKLISRQLIGIYSYVNIELTITDKNKPKPNPPIDKTCTICNKTQLLTEFEVDESTSDRHSDICESCKEHNGEMYGICCQYGIFTANFKLTHQLSTQELFTYLTGAISAAVAINGALLVVPGWKRGRKQRTHLREDHRQLLKDKI